MSIFNAQHKIIAIIEHDCDLLPVLNRFGIKLGFGDITVGQACSQNGIDEGFFLGILNVYHSENYFPEHKFTHFKVTDIIAYLVETHKYYREYVLPEIERLFNVVITQNSSQNEILVLLEKMFVDFKKEYFKHIENEEKKIFPKILELNSQVHAGLPIKTTTTDFNFVNIHSQLDDKIIDIKNLLIKYLPPLADAYNCNAFAIAIFRFEKDIKDHSRIEERILYPRVHTFLNLPKNHGK